MNMELKTGYVFWVFVRIYQICIMLQMHVSFLYSCSLGDPLIACVQELSEIVVRDDLFRKIRTESYNSACHLYNLFA